MRKNLTKGKVSAVLLTAILATVALTGCGGGAKPAEGNAASPTSPQAAATASAKSDKVTIGYATKSSTSPFWVTLNEGAKKAAQDLGAELIMLGPPKENDITGQLQVIEDLVNRKVNGLIVAATDSVGVAPVVKKARDQKIPVIAVDTSISGAEVDSFVATDNIKAAEQAAEFLGNKLGGKGNIVLLNGAISQGTGKERYEGFKNYLEKNYPNMKIVLAKDCNWESEKALQAMEDALHANPQIDAVFGGWDGALLAAHTALKDASKLDKTLIVGFDAYPQALKFVKEGSFAADVAQAPYKMGYEAVKTAVSAAKGQSIDKRIDTGTLLVKPDNVDQYIKDNGIKLP
ncbi:hypothetical protein BC351_18705 [Paenibacillus ferrarius]|uniref:Periplasmic binding protein domain-containing protein n=1 Tax=Paenibacillus ferrarius TaxID=1469647 RepID=A0A1V4HPE9_9BACL|nr:sugar ABC transporter substrate-binding protein [Paenibacillus ferrarius]OPH59954.1 hypothetical protein BC351_18705 [Paenibacillus ferrarius]